LNDVIIKLEGVSKFYGDNEVVKNINLDIYSGEFLTLLGPSGCGKTTTLRMIAGFEHISQGVVYLQGEDVSNKKPYMRDVNTVFQNYALFPHLNVEDNIAFGMVEKHKPKKLIKERVKAMLSLIQLEGMEKRMPAQLSGGQRQRVAIARALVNEPKVLLLDEPLGALDLKLRKQMQIELKHLQKNLGITFVFVTHDQEEALTMSDRIAVMKDGRFEQVGTPQEIYNRPTTKFVADFIGESNVIEAYVTEIDGDYITLSMEFGTAKVKASGFELEEMVYICVRPENLKMSLEKKENFNIYGKIREHVFMGAVCKTIVELPSGLEVKVSSIQTDDLIPEGTEVNLYWENKRGVILHTKEDAIYNALEKTVAELVVDSVLEEKAKEVDYG